jgi:beta-aspartyl-peptidase (threonine type)
MSRATMAAPQLQGRFRLLIHGGAGAADDELPSQPRADAMRAALAAGGAVLARGGPAVVAVVAAVRVMEDSELFNAGRGSAFTADGGHEMDAAVSSGDGPRCGAVAGLQTTRNPVLAAMHVLERSPHVFFAGTGAEALARRAGLQQEPPEYFDTALRRQQLERELGARAGSGGSSRTSGSNGTVGAVAIDRAGGLAAATSTGGMTAKPAGRVGDTPVVGAGTFADDLSCAVSGTGNGEAFLAHAVAAKIAGFVESGAPLAEAAARAVGRLPPGSGGVIAIGRDGAVAAPFSSDVLFRGLLDEGAPPRLAVGPDDGFLPPAARL